MSTRRGAHEEDIVRRMELRLSRSQVCNAHESRIRKVAIRFLQQFDLSAWIRAPPKKKTNLKATVGGASSSWRWGRLISGC